MITLTTKYTDRQAARSIPGAIYDDEAKAYVLKEPTPRAAAVALRLFPALGAQYPELSELRASLGQEVRPFDFAEQFDSPLNLNFINEGIDLYGYQRMDLGYLAAVLRQHGAAYLGWERGLGKTIGAIALAIELDCQRVLVVAPNTAKRSVWEPDLKRFMHGYEVVVLRNAKAQRAKDLGYVKQLAKAGLPFVLVVHYEALNIVASDRANMRGWDQFGEWDMVIADEAHRLANPKALMTRAIKRINTKYKLALSGSIIQNRAEELFSPLQWLLPDVYRSKWRDWNDRYLDYVDSGYSRVCVGVKIEKLDELRKELGVFMVYRTKDEELDLPDKTHQPLLVDLSPAQRKAYVDLQTTCLAQLDDGSILKAADGLVLLTRLRQVATGLDLVSGELADSSKLDLAVELIKDSDVPTVVFTWYRAAGSALENRLIAQGVECFRVDGEVPHGTRAEYIERFQSGERQVFIGTLSTLGESVTLHRASHVIRLDRSWNPATNTQAEDRVYRIGQDRPVTVVDLIARDTVDELRVMPVIQDKENLRKLILGA